MAETSTEPEGGTPTVDPLIGQVLEGRYELTRRIGEGGMGAVYLAQDRRLDREVVVKIPHARYLDEPGFKERFQAELKSLLHLDHPRIVKVHDAGEHEGQPYAVLQYLRGGSLKDRITARGGRHSVGEILEWLTAVCEGLDFLHSRELIHRDVKPGNILFDEHDHPFLADFGIVKTLGSPDTGLTMTGMTPGTPHYMAPEIFTDNILEPSYDQYAIATVVYEMLSGSLPYQGETPMRVLYRKANEGLADIATTVRDLPSTAGQAVMKALAQKPTDRFATCSEFAQAFGCPSSMPDFDTPTVAATQPLEAPTEPMETPATSTAAEEAPTIATDPAPAKPRATIVPAFMTGASGAVGAIVVVLGVLMAILYFSGFFSTPEEQQVTHTTVKREFDGPGFTGKPNQEQTEKKDDPEEDDPKNGETGGEQTSTDPIPKPPLPNVVTVPADGATVGAEVLLRGTSTEPLESVAIGDVTAQVAESGNDFTAPLSLSGGANTLTMTVRTRAGAEMTRTMKLVADVSGPTLQSTTPAAGAAVDAEFLLEGRADEPLSAVWVSGRSAVVDGTSFNLPVTVSEEGGELEITLVDVHANRGTATVSFTRKVPELTLDSIEPVAGTALDADSVKVTGTVNLELTAAWVGEVQGTVDGTGFEITVPLDPGTNALSLVLTDTRGRQHTFSHEIRRRVSDVVRFHSALALIVKELLPSGEYKVIGRTPRSEDDPLEIPQGTRWVVDPVRPAFRGPEYRTLIKAVRNGRIMGVDLSATKIAVPDWWTVFPALDGLEILDLETTPLTDAGLREIAKLKSLRYLNVGATHIIGNTLDSLEGLPNLRALGLSNTRVSVAALQKLTKLSGLQLLFLEGTVVNGAVLDSLSQLPLVHIDLGRTRITGADLRHLAKIKTLRSIRLYACAGVQGNALRVLKDLPNLTDLEVSFNGYIQDGTVEVLAEFPALERLNLQKTNVTSKAMPTFAKMKKLKRLQLEYCRVRPADFTQLRKDLPDCRVTGGRW